MDWKAKKLIGIIETRFEANRVNVESVQSFEMGLQLENAMGAYTNQVLGLSIEEMDFIIFDIKKNEQTASYFREMNQFTPYYLDGNTKVARLLVFIEKNSGYFYTNNAHLFNELDVLIGFLPEDEAQRTDRYLMYLASLKNEISG